MRDVRRGTIAPAFTTPNKFGENMKKFKLICATLLVALSLSTPAFAENEPGDSHTPGRPQPVNTEPGIADSGAYNEAGALADISGVTLADILLALVSLS